MIYPTHRMHCGNDTKDEKLMVVINLRKRLIKCKLFLAQNGGIDMDQISFPLPLTYYA